MRDGQEGSSERWTRPRLRHGNLTGQKRQIRLDVGQASKLFDMPNTGRFDIIRADATCGEATLGSAQVTELRAKCLSCSRFFLAKPGSGLEPLDGGVVIICTACGARQGVSIHLFAAVTNNS